MGSRPAAELLGQPHIDGASASHCLKVSVTVDESLSNPTGIADKKTIQ